MEGQLPDYDSEQAVKDQARIPAYELDDRFVLRDGKRHPAAVICPGGAYRTVASFIEGVPVARKLNELGISAFIVYYRVGKAGLYPAPQEDLARGIREVLARSEEYCIDAEHYSLWGASAGGHLAAGFGTEALGASHYGLPLPSAVVLMYPVITMDPACTHGETRDNLLGRNSVTAQQARLFSIDEQVTRNYPPTYLWCGDADLSVPPENTLRMAAALQRNGVPMACEIFPGVGHGVGPGTGTAAEGWIERAVAFWLDQFIPRG